MGPMVESELPDLTAWHRRAVAVADSIQGVNNWTLLLTTDDGEVALRLYRTTDRERIEQEHRLLMALQRVVLPFGTPEPLPAESGSIARMVWQGRSVFAALFPLLPGSPPEKGNLVQVEACGRAIGQLHAGTAHLPDSVARWTACPPIDRVDPLVPDPVAAAAACGVEGVPARLLAAVVQGVMIKDDDFSNYPTQVIHGDLFGGNMLVVDDEVSAVLDFECAGVGPVMMDVAVATMSLCLTPMTRADRWDLAGRLAAGYASVRGLTGADLTTIPEMLRRREVVSFVDRLGRHHRGEIRTDDLENRASQLVALDRWLDDHSADLVAAMAG